MMRPLDYLLIYTLKARKSFWLNAWSELFIFFGRIYIYIYIFFFFLIYGLETELSGLAAKKLMY